MEQALEATRENADKVSTRRKRHYDSNMKSIVLQPGDHILNHIKTCLKRVPDCTSIYVEYKARYSNSDTR